MFSLTLVYFTYKLMDNLRRYQICHDLITYFAALIFPKKSQLDLIFRAGVGLYHVVILHTCTHQNVLSVAHEIHM